LDHWLDSHAVAAPPAALTQRIAAGAPLPRPRRASSAWWAGAGLAAVGLAGSFAGALAVSLLLQGAPLPGDGLPRLTAFGGLPAELSAEGSEE
ncbi:MAG TPA: hypothetical protein VHQ87_09025, partial [Rhizobacter sp.]|nr:hypothetical protein [Rhizobacter sp.]